MCGAHERLQFAAYKSFACFTNSQTNKDLSKLETKIKEIGFKRS